MTNQTAVRFGYPQTLIREYDQWLVLLREPQATLGSLILCAKSDATEFSALSREAYEEMGTVVTDIEHALKAAFAYEKINYLMLMMVDPNVHFHVLPRYSGLLSNNASDQTSSTLKRLENSISCHRSERDSPGASICCQETRAIGSRTAIAAIGIQRRFLTGARSPSVSTATIATKRPPRE